MHLRSRRPVATEPSFSGGGLLSLSFSLSLSLSLSLFLSRSGVVASCFPEGRIYNFVSLRQVSREGTKRHRGGDARRRTRLVKVFSSQGTHIPGYVPFLQLARLETNGCSLSDDPLLRKPRDLDQVSTTITAEGNLHESKNGLFSFLYS